MKFTKLLKLAVIGVGLLSPLLVLADAEDIRGFNSSGARLPIYHKQRLQFIIYSSQVTKQGSSINAADAVIDIVRKGVDLDHIKYMDGVKPYPLGSPYSVPEKFWIENKHSEGYVASSKAAINQANNTASGNREVYLRSPQLDLNGVGFTANFDKRQVHVAKDVHIIIRIHSPRSSKLVPEKQKHAIIKVTSDRMEADFLKEKVTLIGNVKVDEARFKIDCDRLIVDLNRDKKGRGGSDDVPGGISKLTCIGDVVINRKLSPEEIAQNGEQRAYADEAIYDTVEGQIQLIGENPRIMRGKDFISGKRIVMWKDKERMKVFKNCRIEMRLKRKEEQQTVEPQKPTVITSDFMDLNYAGNQGLFVGNVHVEDAAMNLDCKQMTLYLMDSLQEQKAAAVNQVKTLQVQPALPLGVKAPGKKQVERIICVGDVVISKQNGSKDDISEKALAGRAVYLLKNSSITLSEDNPIIIKGRDSVSGREMTVWLDQNRLEVDKDSRIVLSKLRQGKGVDQKMVKTVVTSDRSDLNYGKGKLYFEGRVNVKDPALKLDCRKMTIKLSDTEQKFAEAGKPEKKSALSDDPFTNIGSGAGKKDIDKVVCIGKVQAEDPRAIMNCDKMTITFRDRPKDSKSNAGVGALGSGSNREIDKVYCDGSFRLESKEDKEKKPEPKQVDDDEDSSLIGSMGSTSGHVVATSDNAMMNIPGNISTLTGNVRVVEPRLTLDCRRMNIYTEDVKPGELDKPIPLDEDEIEANTPRRIAIGDNKKLTKIICHDDVVIGRVVADGERQEALGSKAVYDVFKRTIVLTGTPKKKPLMRQITDEGKNVVEGDMITLWTDSEKLDIKNSRFKLGDPGQLR
ncbi:LptA/OstA family protein [Lentisphaerota bacterium ZTH]|nr:LptA/OstA family protein [Lentisphaerota bacterium ZTH]